MLYGQNNILFLSFLSLIPYIIDEERCQVLEFVQDAHMGKYDRNLLNSKKFKMYNKLFIT